MIVPDNLTYNLVITHHLKTSLQTHKLSVFTVNDSVIFTLSFYTILDMYLYFIIIDSITRIFTFSIVLFIALPSLAKFLI